MPRITLTQELELIEALVAGHPAGLGISALETALEQHLGTRPQRRTLQRRLQKLIEEQRLVTEGESIVLVYKRAAGPAPADATAPAAAAARKAASPAPRAAPVPTEAEAEPEPVVPLSPEGAAIGVQVRRALLYRRPIGYQPAFLQAYQPGESFYLPESVRRQLHETGCTAQRGQPPGSQARDLGVRLLVDLSCASCRLEGLPCSPDDTRDLLEHGQAAPGKDAIGTQMVLNHQAAIALLVAQADELALDAFTFKNLHAVLSQDLLPDPRASGRLRQRPLQLAGTVFEPLAAPQLLEDCFALLLEKAAAIPDPFEQAFFLLVQLPYLQPFDDVNAQVARIGANIPLIKHNLCPLSFMEVPRRTYAEGALGVCELHDVALLRDVFVWAYERSCQRFLALTPTLVEPDPLKIQYREALVQAVQALVQGRRRASAATIAELAQEHAPAPHRAAFAALLSTALQQLHEGSIARYRLRRPEYLAWQQACLEGPPQAGP